MASPLPGLHRSHLTPRRTPGLSVPVQTQLQPSRSFTQPQQEGLENAGRLVDHHLKEDASFVELSGQLRIASHGKWTWRLRGLQITCCRYKQYTAIHVTLLCTNWKFQSPFFFQYCYSSDQCQWTCRDGLPTSGELFSFAGGVAFNGAEASRTVAVWAAAGVSEYVKC